MECPECFKNQKYTNLKLYQINFKEAIYLCPEELCAYPKATEEVFTEQNLFRNDLNLENDSTDSDIETITKIYSNRARQKIRKKSRLKNLNLGCENKQINSSDDEETIQKAHNIFTGNIDKYCKSMNDKINKLLGCDNFNLGYDSSDSSDFNFSDNSLLLNSGENSVLKFSNPDLTSTLQETSKDILQNVKTKPEIVDNTQKSLDSLDIVPISHDFRENDSQIINSSTLPFPIKINISSTQTDQEFNISIDNTSLQKLKELQNENSTLETEISSDKPENNLQTVLQSTSKNIPEYEPQNISPKKNPTELGHLPNINSEAVLPIKKIINNKIEVLKVEKLENNLTHKINVVNNQRKFLKSFTNNCSAHFKLNSKAKLLEVQKPHSNKLSKIDISTALHASGVTKDVKIFKLNPTGFQKVTKRNPKFASKFEGFKFNTKVFNKSVTKANKSEDQVTILEQVSNNEYNNKKTNEKIEIVSSKDQSPPGVTSDLNLSNIQINESFSLDKCNISNLDELLKDIDLENSNLSQSANCKNLEDVDVWLKSLFN